MRESVYKRDAAIENLEAASENLDPYIKTIREAAPKTSHNESHYLKDLNRKKWKKGFIIFKSFFRFRSILYTIPAGFIGWLFTMDIVVGFCVATFILLFLIILLINIILKEKTLQDMTDERKKDYFHYYAYTNHRREYEIFSPYLVEGNHFRFKHAYELMKELDKDIKMKKEMILTLEKNLKKIAMESNNLPLIAEKEYEFVSELSIKLLEKIESKFLGNLSYKTMEFYGHYAIYRLQKDDLILEHCSRTNPNLTKKVNIDDEALKNKSYLKVLSSSYAWESDQATISFAVEVNNTVFVYTLFIDNRNQIALNKSTESGKMNIDRFADVVFTAFKLFAFHVNKNRKGWL
ncbi:hypothetical protein [Metabacillus arenae]|uniref:Uncharacterized protein n=1 Tax=Metabacillus arenae TaxID=2771434 RepID=A0A926NLR2_9BACI|nr:hypothetical protein [Metabacillus arenae]MBD1382918.1 hypothetical protein [Metabacillus arenae]